VRHNLRGATNVQKALRGLANRELVAKRPDGAWTIAEPFFAAWVGRRSDELA